MKNTSTSAAHKIGTREDWLAARLTLLTAEKEHTRRGDELAQLRQELPWVPVEKEYRFDTDEGSASLADIFRGRSQLLVYHLMFGPEYTAACPSCSAIADGFNGFFVHLANHDVMLWAVESAATQAAGIPPAYGMDLPVGVVLRERLQSRLQRRFPAEQQHNDGLDYNYRREPPIPANPSRHSPHAVMCGVDTPTYLRERPGMS